MPSTRPAFSDVSVVNMALALLGENRIDALDDDDSETAGYVIDVYEPTVCAALTSFPWSFATGWTAQLSPLSAAAESPTYQYEYTLPADCLSVERTDVDQDSWALVKGRLQSNRASLRLYYIARVPENLWSAQFAESVSYLLAGRLAPSIQTDGAAGANFESVGQSKLAGARAKDFGQSPSRQIGSDAGVGATRYGRSGSGFLGLP